MQVFIFKESKFLKKKKTFSPLRNTSMHSIHASTQSIKILKIFLFRILENLSLLIGRRLKKNLHLCVKFVYAFFATPLLKKKIICNK